jgi:WD40 repeat protein
MTAFPYRTLALTLLLSPGLVPVTRAQSAPPDKERPVVTIKPGCPLLAPVFAADNRRLASHVEPLGVKLWDAATGKQVVFVRQPVMQFGLSADGLRLACLVPQGIRVWDTKAGKNFLVVKLAAAPTAFGRLALSPDGKRLAAIVPAAPDQPSGIKVWETDTGMEAGQFAGEPGGVGFLAFSPDGKRLAARFGNRVKVWDVAAAEVVANSEFEAVSAVSFSPDGKHLAVVEQDTVDLLDAETGRAAVSFKTRGPITHLAYAADGKRLICSLDRGLAVHDAVAGKELLDLPLEESFGASPAAMSPDGKRLARACTDRGTLHVWDTETGKEVVTRKGFGRPQSVHFVGPGSTQLIVLGYTEMQRGKLPEFVVTLSSLPK